jgi:transposase
MPCRTHGDASQSKQPSTIEYVPKLQLDRAEEEIDRLLRRNQTLQEENDRLRKQLEEARRGQHRQTAPFSRRKRKENPKTNGRKGGAAYGTHRRRSIPSKIDERYSAPLPGSCPCGGCTIQDEIKPQYQEEIVRRKIVRRFDVAVGHCARCGKRLQGRHPLQTSDALDAAQVQIGPEALAFAAHLNKRLGVSYENTAEALRIGFGLSISRSGVCRAVARMGRKAAPTYEALTVALQQELVIWVDETGWKVDAVLNWMWVAVSEHFTVYAILPGRGFEQVTQLIGPDYDGCLEHDGWSVYYRFLKALHQSCLAHLMRRCRDLIEILCPAAARFPKAVRALFDRALKLHGRWQRQEISEHGRLSAIGRMEAQMGRLLEKNYRNASNRRLAQHLIHELPWLFTFLYCPGVEATNNRAERAIRPAVMARRLCGGSRTRNGARTQQILTSVLRTCRQQGKDSFTLMVGLLRNPSTQILDIVPTALPRSDPTVRS